MGAQLEAWMMNRQLEGARRFRHEVSNSLVFHGDDVLVTNLSLDVGALQHSLRTVDGPWAARVKLHTVSKIKKLIPGVPK